MYLFQCISIRFIITLLIKPCLIFTDYSASVSSAVSSAVSASAAAVSSASSAASASPVSASSLSSTDNCSVIFLVRLKSLISSDFNTSTRALILSLVLHFLLLLRFTFTLCFCSFGIRGLICKCIFGYRVTSLKCIVSVKDNVRSLFCNTCYLLSCKLNDFYVVWVLLNIVYSCLKASTVFQFDNSVVLEKKKCSCLVCGIVRYCDCVAICDIIKAGFCSRVNSEWLIVDSACVYKVGSFLLIDCSDMECAGSSLHRNLRSLQLRLAVHNHQIPLPQGRIPLPQGSVLLLQGSRNVVSRMLLL